MNKQDVMEIVCTISVLLSLCLVSQSDALLSSLVPSRPTEYRCPRECECSSVTWRSSTVSCRVVNISQWEETCQQLRLFKNNYPALDLTVTEAIHIFENHMNCLPTLNNLDLSNSSFNVDKISFKGLHVHSLLNLSFNGITNIPDDLFTGLVDLVKLDLSHNEIETLGDNTFTELISLKHLDLSNNEIQNLSPGVLSQLTALKFLNLGYNKIKEITSSHFPFSASLNTLLLQNNLLSTFIFSGNNDTNDSNYSALQAVTVLDISQNPLECSCVLKDLFSTLTQLRNSIISQEETVCASPQRLKGREIVELHELNELVCSQPSGLMTYPSNEKSILFTSPVTLECKAEGYPKPSILWVTPWGDQFYNGSLVMLSRHALNSSVSNSEYYTVRQYEDENVFIDSTIHIAPNNDLIISKFRGYMRGVYTCVAINVAGSKTHEIHLSVFAVIPSVYQKSLFIGGYCASGLLIFGFLVGAVKMFVVWLRRRLYFIVPLFSKSPSVHPPGDVCSVSGDKCNSNDENPESTPASPHTARSLSFEEESDSEGTETPQGWRSYNILYSLEEVRGKFRHGVGRKMKRVKKNVQSIKESGSVYVHNIKETGSVAASRMRAGVVLGVETVKYQVQSFKELCGTGNMGEQTISCVSVETDIDTNRQREVIKHTTFV